MGFSITLHCYLYEPELNLKRIPKTKNIEDLILANAQLQSIQSDILARNFDSFNRQIREPLESQLVTRIEEEYPGLLEDKEDLCNGAFRRIKNDVKKVDAQTASFNLSQLAFKYLIIECESTLPTERNIKNNLGLTKTAFKELINQLKAGDETIIEQVYLSHFEKCVAIVVKHSSCSKELAYECTMDALIEIRTDLQNEKISYGNLESYFTSRAMNKFYKRAKKKKIAEQPLPEGMEFYSDDLGKDSLIEKELNGLVRGAIKKLCEECQYILHLFYYQDLKMNEIGNQMNKSHEAVRKQASRCREKLKNYLGEKFYEQFSSHFF